MTYTKTRKYTSLARLGLAWLGLGTLALSACDFDRDAPDGASLSETGSCSAEGVVLTGPDAVASLGFSAQELLDRVAGTHQSPMVWAPPLDDGPIRVEFSTTPGPAELTATLRYAGGEIRDVRSEPVEPEYQLGGGAGGCPDYLEVDVELDLVTSDGALAETLPATLRSWDPRFGRVDLELPLDALDGSLRVVAVEPAEAEVVDPGLTVGVSNLGLSGGLTGGVQLEQGDAVGFGVLPIASWPTAEDACNGSEAAAKVDGAFGDFSALDVLARINATEGAVLRWQGGATSEFSLGAEHQGEPVCFRAIPEDDELPVGQLRTKAKFSAMAADQSMDGRFEVDVWAEPADDGTLGDVRVDLYAPYASTVDLASFAELYGITGVDLSGFDAAGITFSGVFPAQGDASGALTVLGVIRNDCSDLAPGQGCEGDDIRELAMAEWTTAGPSGT